MAVSGCPFLKMKAFAAERCPFLKNLNDDRNRAVEQSTQCPVMSDEKNFEKAYELFHGEHGVAPRDRRAIAQAVLPFFSEETVVGGERECKGSAHNKSACPYNNMEGSCRESTIFAPPMSQVGLASISISSNFLSGPPSSDGDSEVLAKLKAAGIIPPSTGVGTARETTNHSFEQPPPSKTSGISETAPFVESKCPISRIPILRDVLGDMLLPPPPGGKPVGAKFKLKLTCPSAIIKMRAAFAATPPIRLLRPQEFGVRLAAVAATSFVTNVPMGAWREHVVKFSPEWFVALHASIPLIIMMRKAVLLPQYAIIATIGSAVLGQLVGSRTERKRVATKTLKRSLPPLKGMIRPSQVNSELPSCPLRKLKATRGLVQCSEERFAKCPLKQNISLPQPVSACA